MLQLTRGEIIIEGLSQAGRPDLISNARLWLNLFLEKMYMTQDWDWLLVTTQLSASNGVSLPSDYRATKSAMVMDGASRSQIETTTNPAEWDELKRQMSSSSGVPQYAFLDKNLLKIEFLPLPKTGLLLELSYYSVPELPIHTLAANDLEIPAWGLSAQILIDAIKTRAFEYNNDDREEKSGVALFGQVAMDKVNSGDKRGGNSRLSLGKSFKKRF